MTGPPKRPDIVRLWVEKAEHDLLNIDNNLTASHVPWDTVCFHAQQGAEKYLKALLTQYGVAFPKIHDLTELVALLPADARPVLPPGILEALNPYAIETRYPGVWEPIERDEALRAVAAVRLVRDAVRPLLSPIVLP
jgi:HEPN domain-containing protein